MDRDTLDRWDQDEINDRIGVVVGMLSIYDFPEAPIGCFVCHKDIAECDWDARHRAACTRQGRIVNYLETGTFD